MRKLFNLLFVALLATVVFTSCDDDDPDTVVGVNTDTTATVTGLITTNTTWSADKKYILAGKVVVNDGVTLTIEPGTIIMGSEGTGSLASALVVAQGGKLMAEGTAEKPIIFTTVVDNIAIGQTAGTNLNETNVGLWGGILVLGKALISADAPSVQIEGIPADDTFGLYGGNDDSDNSGVIKYVSIRHGGALIGEGNEINGLTLGGVGNGTTIEYVEVVGNQDDGIECFGGAVDITHALVWAQEDDAYDIDQSYSGTIDNYVYIAGVNSDHGLEIDGPEGTFEAGFTMTNGSLKGNTAASKGELADFRSSARGTVRDSYFFGFKDGADLELDAGEVRDDGSVKRETVVSENFDNGDLVITGLEFDMAYALSAKIGSDIKDDDDVVQYVATAEDIALAAKIEAKLNADNSVVTTKTKGADMAAFAWTYAAAKGALSDF